VGTKWQVVEKEANGVDWSAVRYEAYAVGHFNTEQEARVAASKYLTEVNCNNALTVGEKQFAAEAYMATDDGCFLGVLDGTEWYMTYPKDVRGKDDEGNTTVLHQKGERVKDTKYFELDGKTEVTVRKVPGT